MLASLLETTTLPKFKEEHVFSLIKIRCFFVSRLFEAGVSQELSFILGLAFIFAIIFTVCLHVFFQ